jgi:ubiquitin fusion degradation protein 1
MFGFGGMMGGPGGQRGAFPARFEEQYHCYPVSFQDKEHMEDGDKILLPSSALDTLARLHVEYPMLFEISNPSEVRCALLLLLLSQLHQVGVRNVVHW